MKARLATLLTVVGLLIMFGASPALAVDYNHVYKLPIDTCLRENLAASGNIISWVREPGGDSGGSSNQAAFFDTRTGIETILPDVHVPPVPSGHRLAYVKQRVVSYFVWNGVSMPITANSVHVWDMDAQTETTIAVAAGSSDWVGNVALDGDYVVWQQTIDGGNTSRMMGRNLVSGSEFDIATGELWPNPMVSNGWVVYTSIQYRTNSQGIQIPDDDIKVYEIATGRTYTLGANPHRQYNPTIGPTGLVAWMDFRNGKANDTQNADVYGCNVHDRKVFAIASGTGEQTSPMAGDSYVVYFDSRGMGGYKYVAKDVLSGTVFGVVPGSLAGNERLYVGALNDGTMAWTNTHYHADGSADGTYTTEVYVAQPTEIGALSNNDDAVAVSASRSSFPTGSASAVVACRTDATDVLSAAGMSANQPVLLTSKTSLPAVTAAELRRLGVTSVTILGGTGVVSNTVKSQIDAILQSNAAKASSMVLSTSGLITTALPARHAGRYGSTLTVADSIMRRPGWNGTVIVAGAGALSDAAAAAPLAAAKGMPLLLAPKSGLSAKTLARLKLRHVQRVLVVGNSKSVPQSVVTQLRKSLKKPVVRVYGADSAATAVAIAQYGVSHFGMTWNGLGIAPTTVSSNVTIAALAKGKARTVLLLTDGKKLSRPTATKLRKVRSRVRRLSYVAAKRIAKAVRGQVRAIVH